MNPLQGKRITVAVTGGIAAYKACELVRALVKEGASVQVAMTEAATRFVGPLTFEALSGHPVRTEALDGGMPHLALAGDGADLLVIAPATANTIAKVACGIADNLVSALALGRSCPLAVCPAMNSRMWAHPATQRNIARLLADGVAVLGPAEGELACGASGAGRMLEPAAIAARLARLLAPRLLAGRKAVVTAGPTYEAIDPVRGLTNRSSGLQGYAIARAAWEAGAEVTLVSGPTALPVPEGVRAVPVVSAREMHAAAMDACRGADLFVGVAAVADWRPAEASELKIKKEDGAPAWPAMAENPDILADVARAFPGLVAVGFAAETHGVAGYARAKLERKGAAMIVANRAQDALGSPDNAVTLITRGGEAALPPMNKLEVARAVVARASQLIADREA
ncbi:MAG: bifunctional phosphopantothenoylcysteine decarboxylase/phosphopantothenate--cysteine ligase CoaBC [Duodenibacillus sp.]|nr:bifunctional phosphopantothenoylcysteine decarboxylase/phosphopantothenate--cysteine ligase CoaBC [Duodenibacillus sp.]